MNLPDELAARLGVSLDGAVVTRVLDLARDVAHGSERRFAPLTAYVVGAYVAAATANGSTTSDALAEAERAVAELLTTA
jgi:hypothetical protein